MDVSEEKRINDIIILGLKKIREEKGLSQRAFAYDTGINIGRIESGKANITLYTLKRIANYYGMTIKEFIDTYCHGL